MICFCVSSSTSFPRGARAMKSTSATWRSSFRIRSPPRSPSTKAVRARSFDSSWTVFGTLVPSTAIAFLMPDRRSVSTSCRPSTMMIASLSAMFGPAGSRSDPNETISDTWTLCRTSSSRSEPEVFESSTMVARRARARSMILFRFVTRTSSTFSTLIVALHGPTRSIVSRAAAKMDVSTWSNEDGIRIRPSLRPFLLCTSTSMRPMRPPFCRSRKSSSSPRSPSVWPNTAPRPSAMVPSEDLVRVPAFRVPVAVPRGGVIRDSLHERMQGLHIRDVLSAQAGEARPEFLVEPYTVRREPVPELPGETASADVPVRQDDGFPMIGRDGFAEPENRGPFVDQPHGPHETESPQRSAVLFALHDDRRLAIPLRQALQHLFQILVQLFPIHHHRDSRKRGRPRSVSCIVNRTEPHESDKGCVATPSYIGRRILDLCRVRRRSILNASRRSTGRKAARRPS